MSTGELCAYVVKSIARDGRKEDFDALPIWLQSEVMKVINWYKSEGAWLEVSSEKTEDYAPFAKIFITKVIENSD